MDGGDGYSRTSTATINGKRYEFTTRRLDYVLPEFGGLWEPDLTLLPNGWGVAIADITPELATAMLALNRKDNRNKRGNATGRYADDMRCDRWRLTHQGIAFDRGGHLCDGQHRLTACVLANAPFRSLVFFGAGSNQEMAVHDTGANRSTTDASVYLIGERIGTSLISVVRSFVYGTTRSRVPLTHAAVLACVDRYQAALSFHREAFVGAKSLPAPVRAAVCRAYYHADRADLIRFVRLVTDHLDPSEGRDRAAKLLRKFVESPSGGGADRQREQYCKAQRAVSAYLAGTPLDKLYGSDDDLYPLPSDDQIRDRDELEASLNPEKE